MTKLEIFLFLLVICTAAQETKEKLFELKPFSGIDICIPFSVAIVPSTPDTPPYGLYIKAEPDAFDSISYVLENSILQLTFSGSLLIADPVEIVIYMPKEALTQINHFGPGVVFVDYGFECDALSITNYEGSVKVNGSTIQSLDVSSRGSGTARIDGKITDAKLSANGIGVVAAVGVEGRADVTTSDIAKIYVLGVKSKQVYGKASGLGGVYVDATETCQVDTFDFFSTGCQNIHPKFVPDVVFAWTEYMSASGDYRCNGKSVVETYETYGPGAFGYSFASSTGMGEGATAATSGAGGTSFSSYSTMTGTGGTASQSSASFVGSGSGGSVGGSMTTGSGNPTQTTTKVPTAAPKTESAPPPVEVKSTSKSTSTGSEAASSQTTQKTENGIASAGGSGGVTYRTRGDDA